MEKTTTKKTQAANHQVKRKGSAPFILAAKLFHRPDRSTNAHLDALLDEALQETFPASDPIAVAVEVDSLGPDTRPCTGMRAVQAGTQGVFDS
jgi:hypothetical protein